MAYTPSDEIIELLKSDKFPYRIFVIDTETTGFRGTLQHHRLNQILQVCCTDLLTGVVFDHLCNPPEIDYIPELSIKCHRITMMDIQDCPSPAEVMDELIKFVDAYKDDKRVLMIAHNAAFDREMILKSIKGKALGFQAEHLNWEWMDTLHEIKTHFPTLKKKYWPEQGPHKLETLMKEFYPKIPLGEAHNARADVKNLSRVLCEKLWDKIFVEVDKEEARDHELHFQRYPPDYDPRELSVLDVKGFGPYRCSLVHQKVMDYFMKIPMLRSYKVPCTRLFLVGHIYLYAMVKWQLGDQNGDCVYKGICDEVKLLLRKDPLNIVDDSVVLELCKYVSGVWSTNDFVFHMMTTQGEKHFFQSAKGSKDDWVEKFLKGDSKKWTSASKILMDDYSALMLKEKFNIGDIHDLFMEYNFKRPSMRQQFCKEVQAYFPPEIVINPDTLQQMFKDCYLSE